MQNVSQETIDLALSYVKAKVGQNEIKKNQPADWTFGDMVSPNRQAPRVAARMHFCWYLRVQKQFSYPRIGLILNRDHSSIMHLVEKCNFMMGLPKNYPFEDWQKLNVLHLQQSWDKIRELYQGGMTGHAISDYLNIPGDQIYAVLYESGLTPKQPIEPMPQYVQRFREELADA